MVSFCVYEFTFVTMTYSSWQFYVAHCQNDVT